MSVDFQQIARELLCSYTEVRDVDVEELAELLEYCAQAPFNVLENKVMEWLREFQERRLTDEMDSAEEDARYPEREAEREQSPVPHPRRGLRGRDDGGEHEAHESED